MYPEKFACHVLLLFYPFIKENYLFSTDWTYSIKLLETAVSVTVNQNRQIFEPNSELIDSLLLEISKQDQEEHLYDDRQEHDNQETESSEHEGSSGSIDQSHRQPDISYEELSRLILSLNFQQRKIFNEVQDWAKKKIKARNSNKEVSVDSPRLLITGGAGVGKYYLMETICTFFTKNFNLYSGSKDKPKVLILSPTGVAAININGTTINSELSIPPYLNGYTLPRLSDSERGRLKNLYSEVLVVLIDQISMVSNICLLYINKRLCEIFGCSKSQPFANLSIPVVGDLLQLPPIKAPQIFEPDNNGFGDFFNLWSLFVMVELTEVMRQKGDKNSVNILNNIGIGKCSEDNVKQLQMWKIPIKNLHLMPPYCLLKLFQKMIIMLAK